MKKERLFYLDFIRAIAIISIVIFHFNCSIQAHGVKADEIFFSNYVNGSLGQLGVSLFFIISGAALMYVYDEKISIKSYLIKRFMAIYPMFWLTYIIAFLFVFYINRSINHQIPNWTILLTVFGMDGYLGAYTPTFCIVGEWFLGCIIILYCIFPILRFAVLKKPKFSIACICIFYIIFVYKYNGIMSIDRNFLTRIIDFAFGMYFVKYVKRVRTYQFTVMLIITGILFFMPINNFNQMYIVTIIGVTLYVSLVYIAQFNIPSNIKGIFSIISKYSYAIFLTHHVVIEHLINQFNNLTLTRYETLCLFAISCILIAIISNYVYKITKNVTNLITNFKFYRNSNTINSKFDKI